MEDWFGKRGISGHVTAFIMKEGQYKKATYFTFIDKCVQDGYTSTCVFEDVIKQFKDDKMTSTVGMIMQLVIREQQS